MPQAVSIISQHHWKTAPTLQSVRWFASICSKSSPSLGRELPENVFGKLPQSLGSIESKKYTADSDAANGTHHLPVPLQDGPDPPKHQSSRLGLVLLDVVSP